MKKADYSKEQQLLLLSCKNCIFFENDCPFIKGKFIPYPTIVCDEYSDRAPRRGGVRPGAGRPSNGRTIAVTFRISQESMDILSRVGNKSQFIDVLIKKEGPQ